MYLIGKRWILCKLWFQIVTRSASKQILKRIHTSKWFWKQSFNRLSNEHFVTRDELEFVFSRKDEHRSEIDGKGLSTWACFFESKKSLWTTLMDNCWSFRNVF